MEPKFLRAEEVAQELSVSKPYAYKLIRQLNEELKARALLPSPVGSTGNILTNGSTEQERSTD